MTGVAPIVRLVTDPIDVAAVLAELDDPASGALATFVGRVRDHHEGRQVERLEYSAHPTMAATQLEAIAAEAADRWPLSGLRIVHRLGTLEIGDVSVVVAVASGHRAESFAACRFAIEALKARVPIWKKEHYRAGEARWIGSE